MIILHLDTSEPHIVDALHIFLKDQGFAVSDSSFGGNCVMTGSKMVSAEPQVELPAAPEEVPPEPIQAASMDAVPVVAPAAEPAPATIDVTLSTGEVPDIAPAPSHTEPASVITGELTILDLSSACRVPFDAGISQHASVLCAQNVKPMGDVVAFDYCGLSFKFPIKRTLVGDSVANLNPEFTDTTIRVSVALNSSPSAIPVLLQVVDSQECCVIFGSDMVDVISVASETLDDSVSA